MSLQISWFDLSLVFVYLIAVVALGCYAGSVRRRGGGGEGGHYFLAGNTLGWPVIGLAMFAANISTVHLVSLAESAYTYGIAYTGNFEWLAGFVLILLSLLFAPLYLRSRVATLPDFLERRFNRGCRDWLAFISIISALVVHMGVALYTAAWVFRGILGLGPEVTILGISSTMFFIIVLGVLTGIYTMVGGLLAVVWTESFQTILLLVGAVCITVAGFLAVGGWDQLSQTLASSPHPLHGYVLKDGTRISWGTDRFLHMVNSAKDPGGLPFYAMLLGYPIIGIWYWCCDQTIVQRVLAARDEKQARLGPLFCAFIKILPVFFFVLPGVICVAMAQRGEFPAGGPANPRDAYTFMVTHMLPWGLKGLVIAAMLAAAMQTCSAALNSTATLFAYDIFQRWRPRTTEHQLVLIGKITTVVATLLAIAASPLFESYNTIYEGLMTLICLLAPPITVVFLFGVFWRGASGKAAFLTLVVGAALGILAFWLDKYKILAAFGEWTGMNMHFMMQTFYLFVICCILMFAASWLMPEPLKKEAEPLVWEDWREPLRGEAGGRGLGNYRLLAALVFITFVALYIIFR
ncbi:MAG: sodium/solute symporter [Pirellulales bacterium]|nr:sodium/solute symporter [Pirellulales bacterium]